MTHRDKVRNLHTPARSYHSGFLLLSHFILLHLISPCPEPTLVTGRGGEAFCSEEAKTKSEALPESSLRSCSRSQNTKIITRASKYAMFEMIFLFVAVAWRGACWY